MHFWNPVYILVSMLTVCVSCCNIKNVCTIIQQYTMIIAVNLINLLVIVMQTGLVLCEVRTEIWSR